jgi:hypothetical protein
MRGTVADPLSRCCTLRRHRAAGLRRLTWAAVLPAAAALPCFGPRGAVTSGAQPPLHAPQPSTGLATESRALREARSALPPRFVLTQTRRFVILSDADSEWSGRQAELLERTYGQFHRFARQLQLQPAALRHKLVCVLFREQRDYQAFAREHDGVTAAWISGYYSPRHDRIVFYDLQPPGGAVPIVSFAGEEGTGAGDAVPRRLDRGRGIAATTIHEAVHQLVFHTGIQSARIQNPLWISEGLATAFETERPEEPFGPDRDYALRVGEFRALLDGDRLIPLRRLLQYTEMPDDRDETITAVYHESYALVTWLARHRGTELRRYLESLRSEPPGRPGGRRHLEIFESVFGDADALERTWLDAERGRLRGGPAEDAALR